MAASRDVESSGMLVPGAMGAAVEVGKGAKARWSPQTGGFVGARRRHIDLLRVAGAGCPG